mmetsp:Transcript_31099/g.52226  ORF Transcript_31099/g.52226 Transcript_31099/m.52226 type:complete len:207 (-) Transcript_31099:236-856(-)
MVAIPEHHVAGQDMGRRAHADSGNAASADKAKATSGMRQVSGEVSTFKLSPFDAMESTSGVCTKGPMEHHTWKFGKCSQCGAGEGYRKRPCPPNGATNAATDGGVDTPPIKRTCPTCQYLWVDRYGKSECLKCSIPLDGTRIASNNNTKLWKVSDALRSQFGSCATKARPHKWKFGRCTQCGLVEARTFVMGQATDESTGAGYGSE